MEILFLTRTAGKYIGAGLPNITASWTWARGADAGIVGAMYQTSGSSGQGAGNGMRATAHFDASRSSSIYGNSTTVQPASLTTRYYIKY